MFEASLRVGGRMFTARDDDYGGQVFELGGELIDSNHQTMWALADELGIQLDDRLADADIQADVWVASGVEVPEATIVEQFGAVAPAMADAQAAADGDEDAYAELDETPLSAWLEANVPAETYYTGLLADLDRIFPGTAAAYCQGSARRMHSPSYELTLSSYTCYRPGVVVLGPRG